MAYFWESATMQSRINNLTHLTWTNNRTRLNASNLNQLSNSVRVLSEVLCDKGNSNGGLIQQFDAVRQLVQGDSAPDYSTKDQYKQLDIINRSLYGYRSQHHYQIGDDEDDNSANVLSYFRINEQAAGNDAVDNVSGVLGKVYWKYINQDRPFVDDYQRFRTIFKAGYYINNLDEDTEFSTTQISDKRFGIHKPYSEEMDGLNEPFYFDWDRGIHFQDDGVNGFEVDFNGSIIPISDKCVNLGTTTKRLWDGYFHNISLVRLIPDETSINNETGTTVTSAIGSEVHRFVNGWFTTLDLIKGIVDGILPHQDSRQQNSYKGIKDAPYNNAYIRNGHIEFLNSKNINVLNVLPITLNGELQDSNIGTDVAKHTSSYINIMHTNKILPYSLNDIGGSIGAKTTPFVSGYFKTLSVSEALTATDVDVSNQGNDNTSVVILGDKLENGIDLGDTPTLYNAANQMFGDAEDKLYKEDGKTLQDKTTYALINYTSDVNQRVEEIESIDWLFIDGGNAVGENAYLDE